MRRAWLIAVLALASCKAEREEEARPARPAAPQPAAVATPSAPPIDAPPIDAAPPQVPARFVAYIDLLVVDLYLAEMFRRYPGAPPTTRFDSSAYNWSYPRTLTWIETALTAAANHAKGTDHDAIKAYLTVATEVMPPMVALAGYYGSSKYVDDEFERGRRAMPEVKAAAGKLAAARAKLWSSVFALSEEVVGAVADSPRAVTGRGWQACTRISEAIVLEVKPAEVDRAVSACRRGVASVAALPTGAHGGFDTILRDHANRLGNQAVSGFSQYYELPERITELTKAYFERWPTLASTPAERGAP